MKRLRVLLVNVGRRTITCSAHTPPLGLLYIAAYLRRSRDVTIQVIDQRAENSTCDDVIKRVVSFSPDIVGCRALTADAGLLGKLVTGVKAVLPDVPLAIGGPHSSAEGRGVMDEIGSDIAVIGEGELSFAAVAEVVADGGRDYGHIPGLVWRDASGEVFENEGHAPHFDDLDSLPMPAYDLLNVDAYAKIRNMTMVPRRRYLALFTSRGCPYHCNYCHGIFGKHYRTHSAQRIADEIQYLTKQYGIKDFSILDDIFNLDRKRLFALHGLIGQSGLKLKLAFPNGLRTDLLDAETVDALVDMGTKYSAFALETGTPRLQKAIGKNLNLPKFLEGVRLAVRRKVFSCGFMMLGFPTETAEEMDNTIRMAAESELHSGLFFAVTPFAGTELHSWAMKVCPERLDSVRDGDSDYVYNFAANVSAESDEVLLGKVRSAYRRFYLRPRRVFRILRDHPAPHQLFEFARPARKLGVKSTLWET